MTDATREITDEQRTLISSLHGLIGRARDEEAAYQTWAAADALGRPAAYVQWKAAQGATRGYASALRAAYGGRHNDAIRDAEAFGANLANLAPNDVALDPTTMLSAPNPAHDRACELAGAGWLNQP